MWCSVVQCSAVWGSVGQYGTVLRVSSYVKRDLHTIQKRPMDTNGQYGTVWDQCGVLPRVSSYVKRDLHTIQKRPMHLTERPIIETNTTDGTSKSVCEVHTSILTFV